MEQPNDTTYEDLDEEELRKILRSMGVNINIDETPRDELIESIKFNEKYKLPIDPEDEEIVESGKSVDNGEDNTNDEDRIYEVGEKLKIGKMPPKGLTPEQLRDWWVKQLDEEGLSVRTTKNTSDYERFCLRCTTINPCTGADTCVFCNADITPETGFRNFKRVINSNFLSGSAQHEND